MATNRRKRKPSARARYKEGTDPQFATPEIRLGPWTSYSLLHDPKHMSFVLARYKFCAKMLEGRAAVMEVGCGDGFGLPIVAQAVGRITAVDWDRRNLEGVARRLDRLKNVDYLAADFNRAAPRIRVDAAFSIDVIEHIEPARESTFLRNIVRCLRPSGVLLTGTPNAAAAAHATEHSRVQHINLHSMDSLREVMNRHFENVFLFGMNDEVVHTGFGPMCHYLWALGVGVR